MSLFPKILFVKNTCLSSKDIKDKLNDLLRKDKYEGYFEENILHIKKMTRQRRIITPNITVEMKNKKVSVICELGKYFDYTLITAFFVLSVFEFLILRSFIIKNNFNFLFIFPLIMGIFVYMITYISYKWEADSFRYDLKGL